MNERLIKHIKNKLFEKDEIYDHFDIPTDNQIKHIMLTTLEIVMKNASNAFTVKTINDSA